MGKHTYLAIKRAPEFSPNHINNDEAIFNEVVEQLALLDFHFTVCTELEFLQNDFQADYVFNMIRDKESVRKLQLMELSGTVAINSAFGIENCYRARLTQILMGEGIPHPASVIVDTQQVTRDKILNLGFQSMWVKRGDFHATEAEDVSFVTTVADALSLCSSYRHRRIGEAVISEHLEGDLVKFYGVRGTDFFYWFYPTHQGHSKFGVEVNNGALHYYQFEPNQLHEIGTNAAKALNICIYGGDAIVNQEGKIQIIDLNDWPSFAPCRTLASTKIAEAIALTFTKHKYLITQ